jgi:hypothetical protein
MGMYVEFRRANVTFSRKQILQHVQEVVLNLQFVLSVQTYSRREKTATLPGLQMGQKGETDRWEEAGELKRLIRRMSVNKAPGQSLIEEVEFS